MELAESVSRARSAAARKILSGYSWPEIPRWHAGAFYFSDMYNHRILRLADDGTPETLIDASTHTALNPEPGGEVPEVVFGGIGWLPDGRLISASIHERVIHVWDGRSLELYADLRELAVNSINDMVVDTGGRAYLTQFGFDLLHGAEPKDAPLIVVEPDGSARNLDEVGQFSCGNGVAVTADGTCVIVAEVMANRLTALDRAPDGALSNRRVFAETPFLPDGICLDDQGGVWVGMPGSGVVGRFVEGGEMTDVIPIPTEEGFGVACVLGGPDRTTLYICAGLEVFDQAKSRAEGLGSIWVAETGHSGGENRP
jgi:sugar lactone lactonase YvrE